MQEELKHIWQIQKAIKQNAETQNSLKHLKARLQAELDKITEIAGIEYTGWYVLLKKTEAGFECLKVFNPDIMDEEGCEWDIALPIPKTETYPEFGGW